MNGFDICAQFLRRKFFRWKNFAAYAIPTRLQVADAQNHTRKPSISE
jgi:hypothetical protein